MKLLTICPSRGRPVQLKRMLDSFNKTKSEGTDIVVYIADDDPCLKEYAPVLKGVKHIIGMRLSLVEILNYISCEVYPDIEYYQEVNDDHVYITPGWDAALIKMIEEKGQGVGMAYGWTGFGERDTPTPGLPSAMVMSGNMVRALGCFFPVNFKHTYCDNAALDIGKDSGAIFYNPNVTIEHKHCIYHKADVDENYRQVMSKQALNQGKVVYLEWCGASRKNDTERILELKKLTGIFKDKTVAIVGNAPTTKGNGLGPEIDSKDVVVRINNYAYPVKDDEKADIGSKTDFIYLDEFRYAEFSENNKYLGLPALTNIFFIEELIRKEYGGLTKIQVWDGVGGCYRYSPASGVMCVYMACIFGAKEILITGFDFLRTLGRYESAEGREKRIQYGQRLTYNDKLHDELVVKELYKKYPLKLDKVLQRIICV